MTMASIRAARKPDIGELVGRAAKIRAIAREDSEQTEVDRKASDRVIAQLRDAGLFRIMQPEVYGGYEYGFDALIPVVTQVAAGCGSTGWENASAAWSRSTASASRSRKARSSG